LWEWYFGRRGCTRSDVPMYRTCQMSLHPPRIFPCYAPSLQCLVTPGRLALALSHLNKGPWATTPLSSRVESLLFPHHQTKRPPTTSFHKEHPSSIPSSNPHRQQATREPVRAVSLLPLPPPNLIGLLAPWRRKVLCATCGCSRHGRQQTAEGAGRSLGRTE
jgi:hypothetical protein